MVSERPQLLDLFLPEKSRNLSGANETEQINLNLTKQAEWYCSSQLNINSMRNTFVGRFQCGMT